MNRRVSPSPQRQVTLVLWVAFGVALLVVLTPVVFFAGSSWVLVSSGVALAALVITTLVAVRADRQRHGEVLRLEQQRHEYAALCEARGAALWHVVYEQLPALLGHESTPPMREVIGDADAALVLRSATETVQRIREEHRDRQAAVESVVVALSRSVQSAAHRIQEEAERMIPRHPTDPDVLHTSMRVDHAAAQQARQAQTLAALCGQWPGQQWPQALPLEDVVKAASGRITAYQRVEVSGDPGVAVSATIVEAVIHVVAELLANATQCSPPTTQVLVTTRRVQRGAVIEIDDCGVGLDDSRLERARLIASGRQPVSLIELGEIPQTGLAVVGGYARRHHLRVDLNQSVYGGLRAIVLVPAEQTETVTHSGVVPVAVSSVTDGHTRPASPEIETSHSGENGHGSDLPRRRSRRGEPVPTDTVGWPPSPASPAHTPEEASTWMGSFFRVGPGNAGTG